MRILHSVSLCLVLTGPLVSHAVNVYWNNNSDAVADFSSTNWRTTENGSTSTSISASDTGYLTKNDENSSIIFNGDGIAQSLVLNTSSTFYLSGGQVLALDNFQILGGGTLNFVDMSVQVNTVNLGDGALVIGENDTFTSAPAFSFTSSGSGSLKLSSHSATLASLSIDSGNAGASVDMGFSLSSSSNTLTINTGDFDAFNSQVLTITNYNEGSDHIYFLGGTSANFRGESTMTINGSPTAFNAATGEVTKLTIIPEPRLMGVGLGLFALLAVLFSPRLFVRNREDDESEGRC